MTEPLKLRVGGVYLNRRGERVKIIHQYNTYQTYPFKGDNGYIYTPTGRWGDCNEVTMFDLISEVAEAPPADDLRTRAALAAMTGILAGTGLGIARSRLPRPDQVADMAVDYADALVAKLKR